MKKFSPPPFSHTQIFFSNKKKKELGKKNKKKMPTIISFMNKFKEIRDSIKDASERYMKDQLIDKTNIDIMLNENNIKAARESKGDEIYKNMKRWSNILVKELSPNQKYFLDLCFMTCGDHIYGADMQKRMNEIMSNNGWTEIFDFLMIMAPRREGKSWVVALFAALMLIFVPNITMNIFAVGLRASNELKKKIEDFIAQYMAISGRPLKFGEHNKETTELKGDDSTNDIRCVRAFPGRNADIRIFPFKIQ
jgi:hypothetical protein